MLIQRLQTRPKNACKQPVALKPTAWGNSRSVHGLKERAVRASGLSLTKGLKSSPCKAICKPVAAKPDVKGRCSCLLKRIHAQNNESAQARKTCAWQASVAGAGDKVPCVSVPPITGKRAAPGAKACGARRGVKPQSSGGQPVAPKIGRSEQKHGFEWFGSVYENREEHLSRHEHFKGWCMRCAYYKKPETFVRGGLHGVESWVCPRPLKMSGLWALGCRWCSSHERFASGNQMRFSKFANFHSVRKTFMRRTGRSGSMSVICRTGWLRGRWSCRPSRNPKTCSQWRRRAQPCSQWRRRAQRCSRLLRTRRC